MEKDPDLLVREVPAELRSFYRAERLKLLSVVDLRQVLAAHGYSPVNIASSSKPTQSPSSATKMRNAKGHIMAVSKSIKRGLWLAYDYHNKKGYSAWDFMKGADAQTQPALNIVLKLQNLRRFAQTLGVFPQLNEFYTSYKAIWPQVDKYEAYLGSIPQQQQQNSGLKDERISTQGGEDDNVKKGYSGRQISDDDENQQSTGNRYGLDI